MRIIFRLKCSQLPIGNWLLGFIKFTGDLWIESQSRRIIQPFHTVFVITHTYNTDIVRGNQFRKFIWRALFLLRNSPRDIPQYLFPPILQPE